MCLTLKCRNYYSNMNMVNNDNNYTNNKETFIRNLSIGGPIGGPNQIKSG